MKLRHPHSTLLIATGVVHTLLGFLPGIFAAEWVRIARAGFINALGHGLDLDPAFLVPDLELAFWFTLAGPMMILVGLAVRRLEQLGEPMPWPFVVGLTVVVLVGAVLMPLSGFTVFGAPQTIWMIARRLKPSCACGAARATV